MLIKLAICAFMPRKEKIFFCFFTYHVRTAEKKKRQVEETSFFAKRFKGVELLSSSSSLLTSVSRAL